MKKLLEYLASLIIYPEKVTIEKNQLGENNYRYLIRVRKEDIGKIIGKGGKIIEALRNVAKILAVKEGKKIRIEVAE